MRLLCKYLFAIRHALWNDDPHRRKGYPLMMGQTRPSGMEIHIINVELKGRYIHAEIEASHVCMYIYNVGYLRRFDPFYYSEDVFLRMRQFNTSHAAPALPHVNSNTYCLRRCVTSSTDDRGNGNVSGRF